MAESALVDNLKLMGRLLIGRLVREGLEMAAAWWVKIYQAATPAEDRKWQLFIAVPEVDRAGPEGAYQKVYKAFREVQQNEPALAGISLGQIKVVGVDNPTTKEVLKIVGQYPGTSAAYVGQLGSVYAEEAYFYPPGLWAKPTLRVRLKKPVEVSEPASPQDRQIFNEILASGCTNTVQAGWWVWEHNRRQRPTIPAGTVVSAKALIPNELLLVETPDGKQGVTSTENIEPVTPQ